MSSTKFHIKRLSNRAPASWTAPVPWRFSLVRLLLALLVLAFATPIIAAPKKPKKAKMEKPKPPVGEKPDVTTLEPRGIQIGTEAVIKIIGTNLIGLTEINFNNPKITGSLDTNKFESGTIAWIKVKAAANLPRSACNLTLTTAKGTSSAVKFYADDIPQAQEARLAKSDPPQAVTLPVSFWGTVNPMGDEDQIQFSAKAGQTLVLDLAAKSLGSKLEPMLTVYDAQNHEVASDRKFDSGDPFIAFTVKESGVYHVRIADADAAGSINHFYRLSVGELPSVVGIFPLAVKSGEEHEITLLGYNLGDKHVVKVKAGMAGEMEVPVPDKLRPRRAFKLMVSDLPELVENEPNNLPAQASLLPVPGGMSGRISPAANAEDDSDLFRFEAKAGQPLVIETAAARRGCPTDTKIEVLWPDGQPVKHLQLQAVRNSAITFIDIDSANVAARVENWQEMELNQYLYMQGEVCRIFRMPEGPDSGFQFYKSAGKREDYFDSSATSHALDEVCYIVEPHPPEEKLAANGLPNYPVYYANDDDSERELGSDSRLQFTAPKDGAYLLRVTDSRSHGGDRYAYHVTIRPAKPDFKVTLNAATPTISPGSGQEFTLGADRIDGFDGPITVEISHLPKGFIASTPIVIEAGQLEASGTLCAETNAMAPTPQQIAEIKITARAKDIAAKPVNSFTDIKLGGKPTLLVAFEAYNAGKTNFPQHALTAPPVELTISPGQILPVWLKIERHGHEELVTFTVENLPHGVIIDNIGLNGVLIAKGDNDRQIFLKAAKWVPETDRLCYVQAKQAGVPTSQPVLLHVRKKTETAAAAN